MMKQCVVTKFDSVEKRKLVYCGQVLVLKQLPSALELAKYFQSFVLPKHATKDGILTEKNKLLLCNEFESDPKVIQLFKDIINQGGANFADTCWDRARIRIQQPNTQLDDIKSKLYQT
eukprot:Awhi_evm1s3218